MAVGCIRIEREQREKTEEERELGVKREMIRMRVVEEAAGGGLPEEKSGGILG